MSMISDYVQQAIGLYERTDAVLICDKNGYIEYGKWLDDSYFSSKEVAGMHVMQAYPTLTEETSTIMRVLKTGKISKDDVQQIPNFKGENINIISTTMPIKINNEIIGALCASVYCGQDKDNNNLKNKEKGSLYTLDDIITQNEKMIELKNKIKNVAVNNSTVLIYGETGTGKELVAQSLHTSSLRETKPFISQNCAAIPVNLLEGIFFGTEKGSFTGAESRKGLFELADGGTLFLDEINSMDISMQAKLLKVLEDKRVRRLGGSTDIHFDVRIVCAMNESPYEVLKKEKIREDLFYRIGVVQIFMIPLRQRKDDIILLVDYFIKTYNKEMNMNVKSVSELVKNAFESYEWWGNIRELKNTVESAFNTTNGDVITIKDIPEFVCEEYKCINTMSTIGEQFSLSDAVGNYERQLITKVVNETSNMAEAARKLKISRQNLKYKMEKYNLN